MTEPKQAADVPKLNNPKLWQDPNKIRFADLYKYVSLDDVKIASSMKNYKKSLGYIGGILASCLVVKMFADTAAEYHVFGLHGNGGPLLKMTTQTSTHDYYYNRQFQKMRYLTEEVSGDDTIKTSDALLADLGVNLKPQGLNTRAYPTKSAPHYKYL